MPIRKEWWRTQKCQIAPREPLMAAVDAFVHFLGALGILRTTDCIGFQAETLDTSAI